MMRTDEDHMVTFTCPQCGCRLQALPSAEIRCKCGRLMCNTNKANGGPFNTNAANNRKGR